MDKLAERYRLLLGLDESWVVEDVDLDLTGQKVTIRLQRSREVGVCCQKCGEQRPLKDHAAERTWRHLDTMQFETVLIARTPRTNCPECGVHNVDVPWAEPHGRFTLAFEAFAIRVLQAAASVEQARQLLRLDWHSAKAIMSRAVDRGLERRQLDEVTHIGIDEKNFGKGHDYVSVMTDIDGQRVLEVVPERTREAADSLWETLSEKQTQNVEAVAMDMWPAFMNSTAEHAPDAEIVHDRFHISKHLGDAVDQVRRAENKELKSQGDDTLVGTRYLWLTNEVNLSEEQAVNFESLQKSHLKTSRAWAIRESFRDFWQQPGPLTGRDFFDSWHSWAVRSRLKPIVKVAKMLKRHLDRIVTWFFNRISNAMAEGFNSRIQALKSAARGFRNFRNYRTRILFFCGKLDLKPKLAPQPPTN